MTTRRLGVSAALVDGRLLPGDVEVVDGAVGRVGLPPAPGGRLAAPGYVDLQVNGFAGVDVMTADAPALHELGHALTAYGVTAWLPTLITAPAARTEDALRVLGRVLEDAAPPGTARPLGVHLEGPFLSPHRLGTHPAEHRQDPDPGALRGWRKLAPVVAVTLAPELPGALEMVAALGADGVLVSLGHSDATAEQAHAAYDAGARSATHLFNAMSPLAHRAPGLPGAALARPDVTVQLILDGHHLADDVVHLVWQAARGRVVLVTDATEAAAREEGEYAIAGVPVEVRAGAVRNDRGDLAGSALTLDRAVRNACALGLDLAEVLTAATEAPAALLGRDDLGRLHPGARADVVVLEDDLTVRETWLDGEPVR
ncbi:N-acetylglucosamine-6-phosphate deacetylase [Nocardioides panacis]|uniref:N-acetylglucosamine-6-phosphate deacetylase n=1 Tax=Nocardioides panacis TaxID=2849501 RepID=A0A975T0M0_9ACTN|nr:N-acetylglucosamine-6-phosphate deacetylase [Nocardioides panacis]QWZ09433.1 N-acetylglucosamine-6-phosphate deacetylase [Nocardioides panacis]